MLTKERYLEKPYTTEKSVIFSNLEEQLKTATPPPERVLASKKNRKTSYKSCNNEKKSISRLRSRLLRHLDSIVPNKEVAEQLRVLRVIGKSDALGKWHRIKIAGLISANYSPQSETRLRLLISELIADLSENLGGAA